MTRSGKPIRSASATIDVELVRPVDGRRLEGPRHGGDADRAGRPAGMELVAEGIDRPRRRADEGEPGVLDGLREGRPLRQEAIARVDRLGAGVEGGLDDGVDPQVALGRRRRAEADRDVGQPDVGRRGVRVAVDRDGLDAQLAAGADDPDGDLAAVGDQDAPEGRTPSPDVVFVQRRRRPQSGMLPCFFRGLTSRLLASISRAPMIRGRVSDGRMTSST